MTRFCTEFNCIPVLIIILVMALDSTMTEKALTQADMDLIYTSEVKTPKKVSFHDSISQCCRVNFIVIASQLQFT